MQAIYLLEQLTRNHNKHGKKVSVLWQNQSKRIYGMLRSISNKMR